MGPSGKRNGHPKLTYEELKDDLEQNKKRKEELEKEVTSLNSENDDLRKTNIDDNEASTKRESVLKN